MYSPYDEQCELTAGHCERPAELPLFRHGCSTAPVTVEHLLPPGISGSFSHQGVLPYLVPKDGYRPGESQRPDTFRQLHAGAKEQRPERHDSGMSCPANGPLAMWAAQLEPGSELRLKCRGRDGAYT